MKRLLATATATTLATLATSVGACTSDTDTPDEVSGAPAVGASDSATCPPELGEAFGAWAEVGFSGTIAVVTAGEPEWLAAYGTADAATGAPTRSTRSSPSAR